MPAGYTHMMVSDRALEAVKQGKLIDAPLLGSLFENSHFTQLGSLGPDYPYLDLLQPGQKKWADHMHYDHTGDIIKTMAEQLLERIRSGFEAPGFIIPFSWLLGYISHVTVDIVVHPVVMGIVGSYEGHEAEHRYCEMIQDALIYNHVRNGAEIEHSGLRRVLRQCSDPGDDDKIHPALRDFWSGALESIFSQDYAAGEPHIDEWHDEFEDFLGLASELPTFIGKLLDRSHKFTYQKSSEISDNDRQKFWNHVPLPNGNFGQYTQDVFPWAVRYVSEKWVSLSSGLLAGDIDDFLSSIRNCNMDTGAEYLSEYWGVPA
ncbi:MAG: zinc dependent phospholipase C family protein [Syntrophobacteraceae bacterium]|jgi:hypothetical protein